MYSIYAGHRPDYIVPNAYGPWGPWGPWERATETWKRTQREEGGAEGRGVLMVVEKASEATTLAPSPIGRPLNPGGFKHHDQNYKKKQKRKSFYRNL